MEMYSYGLADTDPNETELYRLNRSLSLGISSLMDIAVHYYGFGRSEVAAYLGNFGFQEASANALYDALLESPANYLKYYVGISEFHGSSGCRQGTGGRPFFLKTFPHPGPVIGRSTVSRPCKVSSGIAESAAFRFIYGAGAAGLLVFIIFHFYAFICGFQVKNPTASYEASNLQGSRAVGICTQRALTLKAGLRSTSGGAKRVSPARSVVLCQVAKWTCLHVRLARYLEE